MILYTNCIYIYITSTVAMWRATSDGLFLGLTRALCARVQRHESEPGDERQAWSGGIFSPVLRWRTHAAPIPMLLFRCCRPASNGHLLLQCFFWRRNSPESIIRLAAKVLFRTPAWSQHPQASGLYQASGWHTLLPSSHVLGQQGSSHVCRTAVQHRS